MHRGAEILHVAEIKVKLLIKVSEDDEGLPTSGPSILRKFSIDRLDLPYEIPGSIVRSHSNEIRRKKFDKVVDEFIQHSTNEDISKGYADFPLYKRYGFDTWRAGKKVTPLQTFQNSRRFALIGTRFKYEILDPIIRINQGVLAYYFYHDSPEVSYPTIESSIEKDYPDYFYARMS